MFFKLLAAALATLLITLVVVGATAVTMTAAMFRGTGLSLSAAVSPQARTDIPASYLALYQAAAANCPGLSWAVLAGIGKVESDHGRSQLPGVHHGANYAGAQGPMQFLPATFAQYATPPPPGGVDPPSPFDPADAIHAAARMLCTNGARNSTDLHAAIWNYNHSDAYVTHVLDQARRYTDHDTTNA